MAPINIDGTKISDVTIDSSSVAEITVDGQTVFGVAVSSGLITYYRFDDSSTSVTAVDSSGNNDGIINGATYAGSGQVGTDSLSLDGTDDYVNPGSNLVSSSASGITFACWIYPNNLADNEGIGIITERYAPSATNVQFELGMGSQSNWGSQSTLAAGIFDGTWDITVGPSPTVGSWAHVAATYDGSTIRLFKNGSQVSSLASSKGVQSPTEDYNVGRRHNARKDEYFNGQIDDVRIYDRALSSSEVLKIYNDTK
jgi:hypothetical protein